MQLILTLGGPHEIVKLELFTPSGILMVNVALQSLAFSNLSSSVPMNSDNLKNLVPPIETFHVLASKVTSLSA